jgi:flagellar basal body-associated protein FliL
MAHLLLACPKCHAAYKIPKEHAGTEVTCRACGHRWIPVPPVSESAPASPSPAPETPAAAPPQAPPAAPAAEAPAAAPPAAPPQAPPAAPAAPRKPAAAAQQKTPSLAPSSPLDALAAMADAARGARGGKGPAFAEPKSPAAAPSAAAKPAATPPKAAPPAPKPPAPKPAPTAAPAKAAASPREQGALDALAALTGGKRAGPASPAAKAPASAAPASPPAPKAEPPAAPQPAAPAPAAPKAEPPPAAPPMAQSAEPSPPPAPAEPALVKPPQREDKTDPLVGAQVDGFKIQARIGSGGFGVVYRAFDTNLERSVALKMLPPKVARAGQGLMDRFLREARSAAKLAHPNIVTIHQICPYKETYYIVMELVDGGALHEFLAVQRRFPAREATRIIRSAAEGLGHAHKRGIIHRDIKPGNIMMTHDGQVKVSDFGLARDVLQGQDIVGEGHSLGTPRYMAPEQALGREPTAASDLYSLAATYYALLTGHAAYDGTDDREIMKKHVQAPIPDPRQHVPDLPVAVFRFFERALAKEPEDRYMTAEEFIEALDRLDFTPGDGSTSDSAALAAQLGTLTAEDRGSHLTEALGRVARRAQRQRTPMAERAVENLVAAGKARGKGKGKVWIILAIVAVLVIGAIAAVAYVLTRPPAGPGAGTTPPDKGAATTPAAGTGETGTGTTTPAETGTTTTPAGTGTTAAGTPGAETAKPPEEKHPMEEVAQEVLKEVKDYEADPNVTAYQAIQRYQENLLDIKAYAGTKAVEEAQKAVDRLRTSGKAESPGGAATPAAPAPSGDAPSPGGDTPAP